MEKKALRRHQQRVARLRHACIIWRSCCYHSVHGWPGRPAGWRIPRKPWQAVSRITMNGEPKHWQQEFNVRPSRIRQNQALRLVLRGVDADLAIRRWPDYRKPHIYYW